MRGKNIYHCLEYGLYLTGISAKISHQNSTDHKQIEWYMFSKDPDDFDDFWNKARKAQREVTK